MGKAKSKTGGQARRAKVKAGDKVGKARRTKAKTAGKAGGAGVGRPSGGGGAKKKRSAGAAGRKSAGRGGRSKRATGAGAARRGAGRAKAGGGRGVERLVRECVPKGAWPASSGDMAVVVAAIEADGKQARTQIGQASLKARSAGRGAGRPGGGAMARARAARKLTTPAKLKRLAEVVSAVASPHRLTILAKLLEGPATYQALIKASGLKVGPLYHHINQLRLASLVAPKERDLYRLTRAGQNVLLAMLAMLPLTTDTRVVQE